MWQKVSKERRRHYSRIIIPPQGHSRPGSTFCINLNFVSDTKRYCSHPATCIIKETPPAYPQKDSFGRQDYFNPGFLASSEFGWETGGSIIGRGLLSKDLIKMSLFFLRPACYSNQTQFIALRHLPGGKIVSNHRIKIQASVE